MEQEQGRVYRRTRGETPMPETTQTADTITMPPATVTLTTEQFQQLLNAASAQTAPSQGLTAESLAQAFAKSTRRENEIAPGISAANPRGDRDHPRPTLRTKTYQNGIEFQQDTLTWEEILALNALPAGEFRVTKANGDKIKFTVKFTEGFDGITVERVELAYPCKDEHRTDHKSLLDYCLEVLGLAGKTEAVASILAVKAELDALRATLT
jgi:hypothetical protein